MMTCIMAERQRRIAAGVDEEMFVGSAPVRLRRGSMV